MSILTISSTPQLIMATMKRVELIIDYEQNTMSTLFIMKLIVPRVRAVFEHLRPRGLLALGGFGAKPAEGQQTARAQMLKNSTHSWNYELHYEQGTHSVLLIVYYELHSLHSCHYELWCGANSKNAHS